MSNDDKHQRGGNGGGRRDRDSEPEVGAEVGERTASLPAAPVGQPRVVVSTAPPVPRAKDARRRPRESGPQRESIFAGVTQPRTTMYEVGEVAHRLSALLPLRSEVSRVSRQAVLSLVLGLTLALLAGMVFAGGAWRLVLGVVGGTAATTLVVFGVLRLIARLAERHGARELPGPALLWVGGLVLVAAGGTGAFTYSIFEVTKPLAAPSRPPPRPRASAVPSASAAAPRADDRLKRGQHVAFSHGVLYVPPYFTSEDGTFDLIAHYHGNTELVEQSVVATKINALVYIGNFGDGSGKYSDPFLNPNAFDTLLDGVEQRAAALGLAKPRIRRIALASWSAGYGALYYILNSRSRLERIDTLLLMDSMHASFAPGSRSKVLGISIAPFLSFARRAAAGEKLMVLTHSAVETIDYPSTTQSANALLERLEFTRAPPKSQPPPVTLPVAVNAFPSGERNWVNVTSEVRQGNFILLGCTGNGKGDHIAHLAQMATTVLPPLAERWREPATK